MTRETRATLPASYGHPRYVSDWPEEQEPPFLAGAARFLRWKNAPQISLAEAALDTDGWAEGPFFDGFMAATEQHLRALMSAEKGDGSANILDADDEEKFALYQLLQAIAWHTRRRKIRGTNAAAKDSLKGLVSVLHGYTNGPADDQEGIADE